MGSCCRPADKDEWERVASVLLLSKPSCKWCDVGSVGSGGRYCQCCCSHHYLHASEFIAASMFTTSVFSSLASVASVASVASIDSILRSASLRVRVFVFYV